MKTLHHSCIIESWEQITGIKCNCTDSNKPREINSSILLPIFDNNKWTLIKYLNPFHHQLAPIWNFPRFREGYLLNNKYMQPNRNKSYESYKTCQKMERFFNTFCLAFTTRGSGNEGRDTWILRIISINLKLCGESFGNEISVKMLIRNGAKIYDIRRYIMGTFSRLQQ